ncbi:uncharacterized protein LOC129570110 [Sitodiplosis mosellana]|uniref:uncharacterized protein LOC129570110 n=1 Tax=Sitodiplosis mosellana TaxID=263140 RepID=UPI0024445F3F|nr:uncharacterized protein LOC129570110 [Sitodiplosis mosellana]
MKEFSLRTLRVAHDFIYSQVLMGQSEVILINIDEILFIGDKARCVNHIPNIKYDNWTAKKDKRSLVGALQSQNYGTPIKLETREAKSYSVAINIGIHRLKVNGSISDGNELCTNGTDFQYLFCPDSSIIYLFLHIGFIIWFNDGMNTIYLTFTGK